MTSRSRPSTIMMTTLCWISHSRRGNKIIFLKISSGSSTASLSQLLSVCCLNLQSNRCILIRSWKLIILFYTLQGQKSTDKNGRIKNYRPGKSFTFGQLSINIVEKLDNVSSWAESFAGDYVAGDDLASQNVVLPNIKNQLIFLSALIMLVSWHWQLF